MKTVVFLLSVITLVGSTAAQSSTTQPPPLFKSKRPQSTRRNPARNPRRSNPFRAERSSTFGDAAETPSSKLTTELDDAIQSQASNSSTRSQPSIYDMDRSRVQLTGGEEGKLNVAPAQFMPNQKFPDRPVDGFLSARDSNRPDPTTGNGLKLAPIPTARPDASRYEIQGPKPPLDFGKPASNPAATRSADFNLMPSTGSAKEPLYGDKTGDSVYMTGHQDNAPQSGMNEPKLPLMTDTNRSKRGEIFMPAAPTGSNVATPTPSPSLTNDKPLLYKQNENQSGYATTPSGTDAEQAAAERRRRRLQNSQSPVYAQGTQNPSTRQRRQTNDDFSTPGMYGQQPTAQPAPVHRPQQQVAQHVQQPPIQQPPVQQQPFLQQPNPALVQPQYAGPQYAPAPTAVVGTQSPSRQIAAPVITPAPAYQGQIAPPDLRRQYPPQLAQGGSTPNFKPVTDQANSVPPGNPNPARDGTGGPNTNGRYGNQDYQQGNLSIMTLLALFASIGLNVYLGWIAYDTYNRYQDLVADMRRTPARRRERRGERPERRVTEAAY